MKLAISTLLVALLAATEVTAASNRDICLTKNRNVVEAVNAFCNTKRNIVVPSAYAKAGGTAATKNGPRAIKVSIGGNCKPPQWVPQKYCFGKFVIRICQGRIREGNPGWKGHYEGLFSQFV
ncbi:hypothetical protein KC340_g5037 [Hortaea werneckii]|nr:hypothetical protein KC342_g9489 [Hortaea werneckii]KAI7105051.1 hypothetical protein KC339_g4110 [Hortaea werneckii]KAI7213364.1 hypothetical protein KC365_g14298 [Hortaea werneckii]KAI7328604.1 hypothetical protein KC340_g5037 [Hortaea werneckii]KAI7379718.1 hypothetical protein KC328_g13167 [Hortaea werneckii]